MAFFGYPCTDGRLVPEDCTVHVLSTPAEAENFAALCAEHGLPMSGVMIEVPAAALTAQEILGEVAFASLGTNYLTQYVMAADRQLSTLAEFNDPWQPAVLRLIHTAAEGARAAGIPLGVCGEAAAATREPTGRAAK